MSNQQSGSGSSQQNIQATDQNYKQWGEQISKEVTRELENRFSSSGSSGTLTRDDVTKAVQQIDFTNLVRDALSGTMRRDQATSKA